MLWTDNLKNNILVVNGAQQYYQLCALVFKGRNADNNSTSIFSNMIMSLIHNRHIICHLACKDNIVYALKKHDEGAEKEVLTHLSVVSGYKIMFTVTYKIGCTYLGLCRILNLLTAHRDCWLHFHCKTRLYF
jgi:hypothetical protein